MARVPVGRSTVCKCATFASLLGAAALSGCLVRTAPPTPEAPDHPPARAVTVAGQARFTVITPTLVRMEYSPAGKFVDDPSLFAAKRGVGVADVRREQHGDVTVIDTGALRLEVVADGKPLGPQNVRATIAGRISWQAGQPSTGNLGGTLRTLDGLTGPVKLDDGVVSRAGWVLVDDSKTPLVRNGWVAERPVDAGTDWYLFGYGSDYRAALSSLTAIAGPIPLPRKVAFGSWYSRYWPYSSADYRQIVDEYHAHDFPLDVMVLDMDWHRDGWTGWSFNRKLLPDAEKLLTQLHERGVTVTVNLHPSDGVGPHEDAYPAFMKALGLDPGTKTTVPFDAADRKYMDALFREVHEPLERAGVDFFWLDWQQAPFTRSLGSVPNLPWLNRLYFEHSERDGKRGMSFSRWGGLGDQRYPIHFSGDADTRWPMLAFEVPFTSTAGNAGCFFWSHDIGGHMGPRVEETTVRWVQFGALSAALRVHSTRSPELDRRPWTYPKEFTDAMRVAYHLRAELLPYVYSSARGSVEHAVPLVRPLYLDHPDDERAYHNGQTYQFGDALLVAPVTEPGSGPGRVATQVVLFPDGPWYDWFTSERFDGNEERLVTAALDEFPLYARGGVPIVMQRYRERMTSAPLDELVVRVWPGTSGKSELYEDDGISRKYEAGEFATTELEYRRDGMHVTLDVWPTKGRYAGMVAERAFVIELEATERAREVRVDGEVVQRTLTEYDAEHATNRIRIPARSVERGAHVEVIAAEIDPSRARMRAQNRRIAALGSAPDPRLVWAVRGVGFGVSNEDPYFLGNARVLRVWGLDRNYDIGIDDQAGDRSVRVARAHGQSRLEIPPESEPAFGVRVRRVASLTFTPPGATEPITLTKTLSEHLAPIRIWSVTARFPYPRNRVISDVTAPPERSPVTAGSDYRAVDADADGVVDLRRVYDADDSFAYGLVFVKSKVAQRATWNVWSDDAVELWVNGVKVHSHEVARPLGTDPDVVRAPLVAGTNAVLIKVGNRGGDWAYRVSVEAEQPLDVSRTR